MSTETPTLNVEKRDRLGSRYAARDRSQGKLPAVIYGHKQGAEHITVEADAFHHLLHHGGHLVKLIVDGSNEENCLLKDVQYDHLGTTIIHADFARVDLNEEVTINVPLEIINQDICVGLKEAGAMLDTLATDIEVECIATNIPESIDLDLSELEANETLLAGSIKLPEGVKLVTPEDTPIVSIHIKHVGEDEDEDGEDSGSAEPEVLTEKKSDDD